MLSKESARPATGLICCFSPVCPGVSKTASVETLVS